MARGPDPEISAENILEIFLASAEPAFVPQEIADELDVTPNGARHQMDKLAEQGYLVKKKPSSRTVLYWISDAGREHYFEITGSG